jgi:hypothetical protein
MGTTMSRRERNMETKQIRQTDLIGKQCTSLAKKCAVDGPTLTTSTLTAAAAAGKEMKMMRYKLCNHDHDRT